MLFAQYRQSKPIGHKEPQKRHPWAINSQRSLRRTHNPERVPQLLQLLTISTYFVLYRHQKHNRLLNRSTPPRSSTSSCSPTRTRCITSLHKISTNRLFTSGIYTTAGRLAMLRTDQSTFQIARSTSTMTSRSTTSGGSATRRTSTAAHPLATLL